MPIDSTFWESEKRRLMAIFLPRLTQMALTGMTNAARQAGISFDNTLYNQRAEAWARTYTDQLLADFGTTTEKIVGNAVADWIAKPNQTVGDLDAVLTPTFGANRANAIAVTETTRAFASGQEEAYKAEGIEEWIWSTNRDDITCPVCFPLNNRRVKIGAAFGKDKKGNDIFKPPAHPRCRCFVRPGVSRDKSKPVLPKNSDDVDPYIGASPYHSGMWGKLDAEGALKFLQANADRAVQNLISNIREQGLNITETSIKKALGIWDAPEGSMIAKVDGNAGAIRKAAAQFGNEHDQDSVAILWEDANGIDRRHIWRFNTSLSKDETMQMINNLSTRPPGGERIFFTVHVNEKGEAVAVEHWEKREINANKPLESFSFYMKTQFSDAVTQSIQSGYQLEFVNRPDYPNILGEQTAQETLGQKLSEYSIP